MLGMLAHSICRYNEQRSVKPNGTKPAKGAGGGSKGARQAVQACKAVQVGGKVQRWCGEKVATLTWGAQRGGGG